MEPKDGKGDGQRSARGKRAPSARKRGPRAVKAADENGATATERESAPLTGAKPAQGGQPADFDEGDGGGPNFGERDADRAADVAADLKSWMDTRREDRDTPREVL